MNQRSAIEESHESGHSIRKPNSGFVAASAVLMALMGLLIAFSVYAKTVKNAGWTARATDAAVMDLASDSKGGIWAIYFNDKLLHAPDSTTVDVPLDDADYRLSILVIDRKDRKWVGTMNGTVAMLDVQGSWTIYPPDNPGGDSLDTFIFDLLVDQKGRIWIKQFNGTSIIDPSLKNTAQLMLSPFASYLVGDQGRMWAEFNGDLYVLDSNDNWKKTYAGKGGAPLAIDHKGQIWMDLTKQGIGVLDRNNILTAYKLNTESGDIPEIKDVVIDSQDRVWVGTAEDGLFMFNADSGWMSFNTRNSGLPDNHVSALAVDGQDQVWAGTDKGVSAINVKGISPLVTTPSLAYTIGNHPIIPAAMWVVGVGLVIVIALMLITPRVNIRKTLSVAASKINIRGAHWISGIASGFITLVGFYISALILVPITPAGAAGMIMALPIACLYGFFVIGSPIFGVWLHRQRGNTVSIKDGLLIGFISGISVVTVGLTIALVADLLAAGSSDTSTLKEALLIFSGLAGGLLIFTVLGGFLGALKYQTKTESRADDSAKNQPIFAETAQPAPADAASSNGYGMAVIAVVLLLVALFGIWFYVKNEGGGNSPPETAGVVLFTSLPPTARVIPPTVTSMPQSMITNTPSPKARAAISPENAANVKQLSQWDTNATVARVVWSPDGRTLAATTGFSIELWDAANGERLAQQSMPASVFDIIFSPNGKILAVATDKDILLWDVQAWKEIRVLSGHKGSMLNLAFSPDGKTIASAESFSATANSFVKLWDIESGEQLVSVAAHNYGVNSIAFSPDGQTFVTAGGDTFVKLWNISGRELATFSGRTDSVQSVAFSPNGNTIASGTVAGMIKLWDIAGKSDLSTLDGHTGWIWKLSFSPGGKILASASSDGLIKLWDAETMSELANLSGHTGEARQVVFSPDGRLLISTSTDDTARVWGIAP